MNKKKTKTTYGVYNLIEWHARLRMGKATVKVSFCGGSITTQGVTPATFTTENPIIQLAIEKSPEFINGKIKVIRRMTLDDVIEIERNAPKVAPVADGSESAQMPTECAVAQDGNTQNTTDASADMETNNDADADAGTDATFTRMEFSCNDDAKDYLEQTFGYIRSKLRNREEIINAGKAHGVEITFV